jgi:hypothetical protein
MSAISATYTRCSGRRSGARPRLAAAEDFTDCRARQACIGKAGPECSSQVQPVSAQEGQGTTITSSEVIWTWGRRAVTSRAQSR